MIDFEQLVVGGLETNCYIIKEGRIGLIIDPGDEPKKIINAVAGLEINLILATHRHFDHISALIEVKKSTKAKAAIHPLDWTSDFDLKLEDGQQILVGNQQINIIHTPGHTPGGCCFLVGDILFSGDTLFPGGPGSTSFGSEQTIYRSIKEKLLILPDTTKVYPGHGAPTTIGQERGLY